MKHKETKMPSCYTDFNVGVYTADSYFLLSWIIVNCDLNVIEPALASSTVQIRAC